MLEKLKLKMIYEDFILKVKLNDEKIKILNMLLNKDTILKISLEMNMSQRTVGYEIKKIKTLYNDYKQLELAKLMSLIN